MPLTLNGTSLPEPMQNGYTIELWQRGKAYRMASGALVREQTNSTLLRRFSIEWTHLTGTQVGTIQTVISAMMDGTSVTLVDPVGTSYTVVLAEKEFPQWKIRKVKGNTEFRYSGTLELEQVP